MKISGIQPIPRTRDPVVYPVWLRAAQPATQLAAHRAFDSRKYCARILNTFLQPRTKVSTFLFQSFKSGFVQKYSSFLYFRTFSAIEKLHGVKRFKFSIKNYNQLDYEINSRILLKYPRYLLVFLSRF